MTLAVTTPVARVSGSGGFSGAAFVVTSASFTPGVDSIVVVGLSAFEATTVGMQTLIVSDSVGGTTGWVIYDQNGTLFNGGGANSEGYSAIAVKKITSAAACTVSASFSWQDNFSTAQDCSMALAVCTGANTTTWVGAHNKTGPINNQTYTPSLVATGAGRMFFNGSEQNGASGSGGAPTTSDTADLAYLFTVLGCGFGRKTTNHSVGTINGNLVATGTTFWNGNALEILEAAGSNIILMGQACL